MLGETTREGGPILAGPLVRLACERHLRDRERKRWFFDEPRADYVISFFETVLKLPDTDDGTGRPRAFLLEPAQDFIIGSLFGWIDGDGVRRFREAYIEAGKGSGKTPLLAGIGLYGLTMDGERAAEIYAAAVTRDQAAIMFRDAARMINATPDLKARLRVSGVEPPTNISDPVTLSFFRPFSRDQGIHSGPRPHMGLIDELHEHQSPEVVNKMRAGAKFRKQPLFPEITNSGFDRTSICWDHHEHARKMLEGTLEDERLFAYVCSLDKDDDPLEDPSCWIKANPLLGVTITREYLERQIQNAKNLPTEKNTVLRLNFCQWTQSEVGLIDMKKWRACQRFEEHELEGALCYGGLDLGYRGDFSSFARVWMLADGRVAVKMRRWLPQGAIDRIAERDQWRRDLYLRWAAAGLVTVTDGDATDLPRVGAEIDEICRSSKIASVGYDPKYAEEMRIRLEAQGVTMVSQTQGFQLNESVVKLQELIAEGKLCHNGDECLSWMAENAVGHYGREGDVRLAKDLAKDKIDDISAIVNALKIAFADAGQHSPGEVQFLFD